MFMHNFKYSFKTLFKNKPLIFWTFVFPIILGTLFSLAFSNIESSEKLDIIPIGIVDDNNSNLFIKEIFKQMGDDENSDRIFDVKFVSLEDAQEMLSLEKIDGYLVLGDIPKIVILRNGVNQTIFKYVVDEIYQSLSVIDDVLYNSLEGDVLDSQVIADIYFSIMEKLNESDGLIIDKSSNKLSYTMIEYYTLIAMACLYSGILSMYSINQKLPNMSNNGKRISVSPVKKGRLIFSSLLASYITQIIGLFLLFIFTIFVLKVDYGDNLFLVVMLSLVGSLAGLSLGMMVGSVFKCNENMKIGLIISFTMFCSFLSGMMGITMKYVVDKNIPILNIINPANMITDGFYSLYYYDGLDRFYFNFISLLIFAFVMIIISMACLRRQKYDSI